MASPHTRENHLKNYHNLGKINRAESHPTSMDLRILKPDFRCMRYHCFPVPWDRENQSSSLETFPILPIIVLYEEVNDWQGLI